MDHRLALALKLYDQGLPDAAWHAVQELARADDAPREALHLAAVLCLETAHHDEALRFAERLIAGDGADVDAHLLRGQALRELGHFDEAFAAFTRIASLRAPDAGLHLNLALLHHRTGRLADSEAAYRAALALDPANAGAWNNLGLLLDDSGQPEAAAEAFAKSIALAPQVSITHNNLGVTLAGQGRYAAAARAHEKALALDPRNIAARINLGVAQVEQGALEDARRTFDSALAQGPLNRDAADNRLYLDVYMEPDPARICARHRAWGHELNVPGSASGRAVRKPLKVGYVSADFRRHSVSFFVEALLRHHDPDYIEVQCWSDVAQADAVTARLKSLVPQANKRWHDVAGWDDERLRAAIRAADIDVLVDLGGHTNGNRLAMFAKRAAPIQVSALGYPATTGVLAMDYRLCDAITDPPGSETFSTEKLMRLHALHCFTPPEGAPALAAPPALARGHITFGSFNKLAKISDDAVRVWAGVLTAVPGSRLLLKTKPLVEEETRASVVRRFAAHGIDASRLDLRGWQPGDADHLAVYRDVDIALDTFPYNGTTTTCEALWMGVPVVSLTGRGHAARVGASLLTSAGLRSWCAANEEGFRDLAVKAAADVKALTEVRAGLRGQLRGSRLCDGLTYARDVESAYRAMFE
jgi:predicted O-linked N-acetylglucosamine transferase (SPINDLY family)